MRLQTMPPTRLLQRLPLHKTGRSRRQGLLRLWCSEGSLLGRCREVVHSCAGLCWTCIYNLQYCWALELRQSEAA